MKRLTAVAGIAFSLLCAASVSAQVTLEALSVTPPAPTTTDNIVASVSGMVNVSDLPNFRSVWKREADDILVDVLHDFIPAGAPPLMLPYTEEVTLGNLPAGTYDLTARLFSAPRLGPEPPFPDPWHFPATDERLVGTLNTTFTVVPEPSSLVLVIAGALLLLRRGPATAVVPSAH